MLHLEDLIQQPEESCLHPSSSSEAKCTFTPELKEFEDHPPCQTERDFFFQHPGQQPHSSTFSHLPFSEQHESQPNEEGEGCAGKNKVRGKVINKSRNETKNIPKNFGKGIISFVENNKTKLAPLIRRYGYTYQQLVSELKQLKKKINTIAELRELWMGQKGPCLRVVSNLFFRKYALEYIFNSRISSYGSHIKYRSSLWQALKSPQTFNHIKQY